MIEQIVEFSTKDGDELEFNSSFNGKYGINPSTLNRYTWEYYNEGLHSDLSPYAAAQDRGTQRGIVLRFRPNYQFPFKSLSVEGINIPYYGMTSRIIGTITLQVTTTINATTPGWPNVEWAQLVSLWHLWDEDNFADLFNAKMRIVCGQIDPAIAGYNLEKIYRLDPVGNGDYNLVIFPQWQVTITGVPFLNFGRERIDNFFGTKQIVDGGFDYTGYNNILFQRTTLPRDDIIYLNSRVVVQENPDMCFSRNMQNINQTSIVASFCINEDKSKSEYSRTGYPNPHRRFVAKNHMNSPVTTKVRRDFCCVHYIDFWFTYGEKQEPLYEEFQLRNNAIGGVPANTTDARSILRYKIKAGAQNISWVNQVANLGYSNTFADFRDTTTYSDFAHAIFKDIGIFGVFNKCDCLIEREETYIKP